MTNWTSTTILVKLDYERRIGMFYCASRRRPAPLLLIRGVFVARGPAPPPGQRL